MNIKSYDRFQGSNDDETPDGDPVFQDGLGKWNFWDETWTNFLGPYDTESQAREELIKYTEFLETGIRKD